jgi:hypothetical protein
MDYAVLAEDGKPMYEQGWKGQLRDGEGNMQFRIKFYGQLHQKYSNLIVGIEGVPPLVIAESLLSGKEIVLFDGCVHGYNAMFCDEFPEAERADGTYYRDKQGEELFSVVVSVCNSHFFLEGEDDELEVDEDGMVTLLNGKRIDHATAKRDAFDGIGITVRNASGFQTEILQEELA